MNSRWKSFGRNVRRSVVLAVALATVTLCRFVQAEDIRYNRDILPILSDKCFFCHGPDEKQRKAKLRLDIRDEALAKKAFVPGKPDDSELIKRIFTTDKDDVMPPLETHKKLTAAQKELLRKWIGDGAKYETHWAYTKPVKRPVPDNSNVIDFLVSERLKTLGLSQSPEADRRTLARRLSFDLIGLPPKPEEVEAFVSDTSPEAYQKYVEKLLNSPHFGERMAIGWLDVVRFADTIGYHSDNPRNIYPYRDYVIKSFNENKRFDRFTVEQIAGDLLPNANLETRVGSAFNRLLLTTEEGGAQPKDYEARMLTDRVRAIGTVWLGQTIGCAQCHDHKFDPITMRDFYSLGTFFADIQEPIIGRREPGMLVPNKEQETELARLDEALNKVQQEFNAAGPELAANLAAWEKTQLSLLKFEKAWAPLIPSKSSSVGGAKLESWPDHSLLVTGEKPDKDVYQAAFSGLPNPISALKLEVLPDDSLPSKGPGRAANGNFVLTELVARVLRANGDRQTLRFANARADVKQKAGDEKSGIKSWAAADVIDGDLTDESRGWAVLPESGKAHQLVLELEASVKLAAGDTLEVELHQNHGHGSHTIGRFRISGSSSFDAVAYAFTQAAPKEIVDLLQVPADKRDGPQKEKILAHYKTIAPELTDLRKRLADASKAKTDYEGIVARCLVSVSGPPRTVRILPRGNFLIETGEIVQPALPEYLAGKRDPEKKLNRLDLANWLISRENPLTARVVMNRMWKQFFGTGLSKVLDDLGAQGEPPPNQALLDWLACEFMDSGWDMKQMVRLMVTSKAYRQSSSASEQLRNIDPYNRELASQSRWRLEAELVRDNALAISGLLVAKIGGPSVKPYQPDGYWENLNFPPRTYEASKGEDQYRRGIYAWWQRSFPHPSLIAFDAPSREECVAERTRSNIPQQALVILNDPTYVEASRAFATRILKEGGSDLGARIKWAWRQALARDPRADEMAVAEALVKKHLQEYEQNSTAAKALISVGDLSPASALPETELAAWTNLARVILNLHETITRS